MRLPITECKISFTCLFVILCLASNSVGMDSFRFHGGLPYRGMDRNCSCLVSFFGQIQSGARSSVRNNAGVDQAETATIGVSDTRRVLSSHASRSWIFH